MLLLLLLRPLAIGEVSWPVGDMVKSELLKRERLVLVEGLRLLEEATFESLQQSPCASDQSHVLRDAWVPVCC